MTLQRTIKHLCALKTRIDLNNFGAKAERRALDEAIMWLAGERRREVRADLRGKIIDHIDGNAYNCDIANLRVSTMKENNR